MTPAGAILQYPGGGPAYPLDTPGVWLTEAMFLDAMPVTSVRGVSGSPSVKSDSKPADGLRSCLSIFSLFSSGSSDEDGDDAGSGGTSAQVRPEAPVTAVPEAGEYAPDPVLVKYTFTFADATQLIFKEHHGGDYWGEYPAAGWGQIIWPSGVKEGIDVNTRVRKAGLPVARVPVTTPDHGQRLYWLADSEGRVDVKKVTIFEDGWNPLVEGAVLATKDALGITSHLTAAAVVVERRK